MRKILITALITLCYTTVFTQESASNIRLNQIGFLPYAEKIAAITDVSASKFEIIDTFGTKVFESSLSEPQVWSASGETVKIADFSIFATPGIYHIQIPGYGKSFRFEISDTVFSEVNKAIVKAFYFNRASLELLPEHAGIYARAGAHWDTEVVVLPSAAGPTRVAGDVISAPKGWYDAGDYNKYIVNSGITTGTLLMAYENYASYFDTVTWNIPESGNSMPDLLNEIKWNLDWMLTMQDPADGGVYNKTTDADFCGYNMPHAYSATRYVVAKGTAAALDFAAVMALAARIYEPFDQSFSQTCLDAAEYAWEWAVANPFVGYINPSAQGTYPGVATGGYGDSDFSDERVWAASELFITTKNTDYKTHIKLSRTFDVPNWRNVAFLSLFSLYTNRTEIASEIDTSLVINKILLKANALKSSYTGNPYKVPASNFPWGSNGEMANQGMILLYGFQITADVEYFNAALSCYDYILGRNATEYSFITQYGSKSAQNVHHRVSVADNIPGSVPGFLAGGPNSGNKTDCSGYPTQAAKAYLDMYCSYTTNEIAINWQAAITYLAHAIPNEYTNWLKTLPASFAVVSTNTIDLQRLDENAMFSVFSNTEWHIASDDDWYAFSEDTLVGSGVIYLSITSQNEGDTIRSGQFAIMIGNDTISTVSISHLGRMKDLRIEAESYVSAIGVQTEATEDIGGGLNVGWIDDNDSMTYMLDITHAGSYEITYRYAALSQTCEMHMILNDSVYSLIQPSPTGGWQNWIDVKDTAYFEEGVHEITLFALTGGFNLNYFDISHISDENIAPMHYPTIINPPSKTPIVSLEKIVVENPITQSTFSVFGLQNNETYTLTIYTIHGVAVTSMHISAHNNIIPFTEANGIYYVEIVDSNNFTSTHTIIKQ